jgi:hypothetical protein
MSGPSPSTTEWVIGALVVLFVLVWAASRRRGRFSRTRWGGGDDAYEIRRLRRRIRRLEQCTNQPVPTCVVERAGPGTSALLGFRVEHTVFVDGRYGNNATALVERPDRPYRTISAAISAAAIRASVAQQWQVQVRPDLYTENVTMASYVDLVGAAPAASLVNDTATAAEVIILGILTVPVELTGNVTVQNVSVSAFDAIAVVFEDGVRVSTLPRSVFFVQSSFVSSFTGTELGLGTVRTMDIFETSQNNTSVRIDDCNLLLLAAPVAGDDFLSRVIYTKAPTLELLRSRLTVVFTLPAQPVSYASGMVLVESSSTGASASVLSQGNQFASVFNFDAEGQNPAGTNALFVLEGVIAGDGPVLTVGSNGDVWSISGTNVTDGPAAFNTVVLAEGATAELLSMVQSLQINLIVPIGALGQFTTLFLNGAPTNNGSHAYFHSILFIGVPSLTAPFGLVDGQYRVIQTDLVVDETQEGQFYPGTMVEPEGDYTIQPADAVVVVTAPDTTVSFPALLASNYPARFVVLKNASGGDLTVTNLSEQSPYTLASTWSLIVFSDGSNWMIAADFAGVQTPPP